MFGTKIDSKLDAAIDRFLRPNERTFWNSPALIPTLMYLVAGMLVWAAYHS